VVILVAVDCAIEHRDGLGEVIALSQHVCEQTGRRRRTGVGVGAQDRDSPVKVAPFP
jgi:hypothetical protein